MDATEAAIDLMIKNGLFLAPRRVLLAKATDLKRQSQVISKVMKAEKVEEHKAA
jgi:hypothetical protein